MAGSENRSGVSSAGRASYLRKFLRIAIMSTFVALFLIPGITFLFPPLTNSHPFVFATGPLNAATNGQSGAATAEPMLRHTCYSNGYYFIFYYDGSNMGWISSQTGASWSAETTIANPTGPYYFSLYCDGSSNIYLAYRASATTWAYRAGTTSSGSITWAFAAQTLTCTDGGSQCAPQSVYAFDTTHVWVGVWSETAGAVHYSEVWDCQTSPCSSTSNWADSVASSTYKCEFACDVMGLSSNQNVAIVTQSASSGVVSIRTTSDGGSSWSSAVATLDQPVEANVDSCLSSSSTVYCTFSDINAKKIQFETFVQGGASWSESTIDTFTSAFCSSCGITDASDGIDLLVVYPDPTAGQIDYQTSGNMGSTWSGRTTLTTGESSPVYEGSTPTLQSLVMGIIWTSSTDVRFMTLTGPSETVTQPITCTMDNSGSAATLTLSGGSPSPSTVACDGSTHNITVNPLQTLTATEPSDASNARDRFSGALTTLSVSTCSTGTCSGWSFANYKQLLDNNPGSLTIGIVSTGSKSNVTTSTFFTDYGRTLTTYGIISCAFAPTYVSWINQEASQGFQVLTNVSLGGSANPFYSSSSHNLGWGNSSTPATHAKVCVPSGFTVNSASSTYSQSGQVYDLNSTAIQYVSAAPSGSSPGNIGGLTTTQQTNQSTTSTSSLVNNPHPHPNIPPGATNSTNWAGYVVVGVPGTVTGVAASWKVPVTACGLTDQTDVAYWLGLDGFNSSTVEQTGVLSICNYGQVSYIPWYEFYPSPMQQISNFTVHGNDTIFASVVYINGEFTLVLKDLKTGSAFSTTGAPPSFALSSAEWITEDPSGNGQLLPLASFGKVYFGYDHTSSGGTNFVTVNSISTPFAQVKNYAITMMKNGKALAYPSPYTGDGTSFIVYGPSASGISNDMGGWLLLLLIILAVGGYIAKKEYAKRGRGRLTRRGAFNRDGNKGLRKR